MISKGAREQNTEKTKNGQLDIHLKFLSKYTLTTIIDPFFSESVAQVRAWFKKSYLSHHAESDSSANQKAYFNNSASSQVHNEFNNYSWIFILVLSILTGVGTSLLEWQIGINSGFMLPGSFFVPIFMFILFLRH